jgi:peptide methionine sulfoxide reductase MsrA
VAAETKRLGKQVVTEVVPFTKWWPAEEYHQKYLEKGGQVKIPRLQEAESSFADDNALSEELRVDSDPCLMFFRFALL